MIENGGGSLPERGEVAAANGGKPPLTSLCVHQDGTIGDGYAMAPKSVPSDSATPVDDLGAQHRLLCYQRYADDLPEDGGIPTVTPKVAEARARRKKVEVKPRAVCPIHFMELSTTGVCAECEWGIS